MQCKKCGRELKKDRLYCEYCGEEICIVPNFEPEIENRINESLSAVAESVEPGGEMVLKPEKESKKKRETRREKLMYWGMVAGACVILILTLSVTVGLSVYHDNVLKDKMSQAQSLSLEGNYTQAISIYEEILKKDQNTDVMIAYAECLYAAGNYDKALNYLYAVIDTEPDNDVAYAVIIAMYDEQRKFDEINQLLKNCTSESVLTKFKDYMSFPPQFSVASGTYNKTILLVLSSTANGKIFYSLDGSNPEKGGIEYTTPIL